MSVPHFYVKSFEDDFVLKTLEGQVKVPSQSLAEIVKTGVIKPNTNSFGAKKRLSTTILHPAYAKTYRPQGLIFQTNEKPSHVIPFDLVLCSDAEKMVVQYYRIQGKLHEFYDRKLIPGYERFIFKDVDKLIAAFPNPQAAWKAVNDFRVKHGLPHLPKEKFRLALYNEAVFEKPVKIIPVAVFGYRPEARQIARELGLPCFRSAAEFTKRKIRMEQRNSVKKNSGASKKKKKMVRRLKIRRR